MISTTGNEDATEGEILRREIRQTGHDLGEHLGQLKDEVYRKVEDFYNPLGIKDAVSASPLLACATSFILGAIWGARMRRRSADTKFQESPREAPQAAHWGSGLIGQVIVSRLLNPALTRLFERY
jgi:hypothetical protein